MIHSSSADTVRGTTPLWQMPLALLLCWFAVLAQVHPSTPGKNRTQGFSQLELLGSLASIDRTASVKRSDDSAADGDSDPPDAFSAGMSAARLYLEATVALTDLNVSLFSRLILWSPSNPRAPPL